MRKTTIAAIVALSLFMGTTAMAQEAQRQLDAHVHGSGKLDIAIEGNNVALELEVPGMDIVGFEHEARTDEHKAAIEKARILLLEGLSIFKLPAGAGCKITTRKVDVPGHEDKQEEHKEEEGETHSEFHAEFALECTKIAQLKTITFPYFSNFPRARELNITIITEKSQTGFEVTGTNPKIDLGKIVK